jgi:hypothetical protein
MEEVHLGDLNVNGKIKLDIWEIACVADKLIETLSVSTKLITQLPLLFECFHLPPVSKYFQKLWWGRL